MRVAQAWHIKAIVVSQNSGKNQKEVYVEEYPEGCEFKRMGIRRFVINYSICHG